jgi:hypothetical protein
MGSGLPLTKTAFLRFLDVPYPSLTPEKAEKNPTDHAPFDAKS